MTKIKNRVTTKSYWTKLVNDIQKTRQHRVTEDCAPLYKTAYTERRAAKYALGEPLSAIYFTQREAECMMQWLQGKTMHESGHVLHLSPRTVEYYLSKIKRKLRCRKKRDLIDLVSKTEFAKNFNQDPYNKKPML